ncbi:2'-5' RNA ligase family protein [Paenibacillus sp. J2TS4]|uniref:2'-5' RNA ligase family protein n=1 Tax=Paenibacillus sp. J2TS4 TaxID=2807194 RepID=UPI001B153A3E|nr:2'-5' RNA ligase family protein [Paenibacillus sp. J2TS4]GIP31827.1 hypothetical protein J2TS4_10370 [Paenibacillus sp. J2TS4]
MDKTFSLQILLPDNMENQFIDWTNKIPYASRASWGGHITLISSLRLVGNLNEVAQTINEVCSRTPPIPIQLNHVVCEKHLVYPDLKIVYLEGSEPNEPLNHFQNRLMTELMQLTEMEEIEGNHPWDYNPHLSLTLGLENEQANEAAEAARRNKLEIQFSVTRIWLMENRLSATSGRMDTIRLQSFDLGSKLTRQPK